MRDFWEENKVFVGVLVVGLVLVGVGVVEMVFLAEEDEVVVTEPEEREEEVVVRTVVVDVAGAVKEPGVYRMDEGVRIADALEQAGGYAEEVNMEWVAEFVNQAEEVEDGQKIYIPFRNESTNDKFQMTNVNEGTGASGEVRGSGVVNVNTASVEDLDELWGVGAARAGDIVANRPYGSVEDLKEKAGLPQNVLEKNEGKIGFY